MIRIEKEICTGCGICIGKCPFGALRMEESVPVVSEGCLGCNACVEQCPAGAISKDEEACEGADISAYHGVLVLSELEPASGKVQKVTLELISEGRRIADKLGEKMRMLLLCGQMPGDIQEKAGWAGCDEIILVKNPMLQEYNTDLYTDIVARICKRDVYKRQEEKLGGKIRAVADIGSHWLDLAQFVTGQNIKRVCSIFDTVHPVRKKGLGKEATFSKTGQGEFEEVKVTTEDEAAILVELENGAIGTVFISQVFAGKKNTTELSVAGTRASLAWNSEALGELGIGHRDGPNEMLEKDPSLMCERAASAIGYPGGHAEGFPDAIKQGFRQFYDSLERKGDYQYATFQDGLEEMRLCDAILKSAQTRQWVEV